MGLSCIFGHSWDGCKCTKCGKTRNIDHDWDLCKGVCKRCGSKQTEMHDWDGCKCKRCGATRDEGHDKAYVEAFLGDRIDKITTKEQTELIRTQPYKDNAKKEPAAIENRDKCTTGDRIIFGCWNGVPLPWKVLAIENDSMLLLAENLLGRRPYHSSCPATWDVSQLRADLNGNWFYNNPMVFSQEERRLILPVTNDSPGIYYQNQTTWEECYAEKGNETEDYVFLISCREAMKYFKGETVVWQKPCSNDRFKFYSSQDMAADHPWWLRNVTRQNKAAVIVTARGVINCEGFSVNDGTIPEVRPAVWISKQTNDIESQLQNTQTPQSSIQKTNHEGIEIKKKPLPDTHTKEEITDDSTLIERFENSDDPDVRLATLKCIRDEAFHTRVAKGNYDAAMRRIAVGHIRNQDILTEMIRTVDDTEIRRIILKKVNDQELLEQVAQEDSDLECRSIAISRLTKGKILAAIALDRSQPDEFHQAALKRLMKLKDLPALESVFNGLDDGMDKTNVAGTLKQLESKTVNDWIERQRMQSDIRQVQNLYNRGDKARAQSYASIVGVRIGESLQATPNTTGKTVSRVVDLRSDTERRIESQTGNVLAPEREQLAREMTAFLKTHDTGNNAEHYREFRDRFHKRSEAIAEGGGYHQALLEIYHRIQKLCKEQGIYFHSGGVDHVFEGNYWHN